MEAIGYAVVDDDQIDLRTVSQSPTAAMVNWLWVVPGVRCTRMHTDDEIKALFEEMKKTAIVSEVTIAVKASL